MISRRGREFIPEPGDVEGRDYVVCRLCMAPFRVISGSHLRRFHDWDSATPVLEYVARFGPKSHQSGVARANRRIALAEFFERTGRRWTKKRVLQEIRRRQARKQAIHYQAVRRARPVLAVMATEHFGSWDKALATAGLDPASVRLRRAWSPERVIVTIRRFQREGRPLNVGAVKEWGLVAKAVRAFGSWDQALRSSGIDPAGIRKDHMKWTKEEVLRAVQRMGSGVRHSRLKTEHPGAVTAAYRYFGSWANAVRKAGFRYKKPPAGRPKIWTREAILAAIRERGARGLPLSSHRLRREGGTLYDAALREFGGWRRAVEKAGCSAGLPLQHWTPTEIVDTLKRLHAANGRITGAMLATERRPHYESLSRSIERHFGNRTRALTALGLTWHRARPQQRWSKELVVEEIRRLHREGKALNRGAAPMALQMAALTYWGSWDAPLAAAGFDPERIRKTRSWSRERVLAALLRERAEGRDLAYRAVVRRDSGLATAAVRYLGSWTAARRLVERSSEP